MCADIGTETVLAGTAYFPVARGAVSTTFVDDDAWLARRDAWAISPDLPLSQRSTAAGLPGALADSAPHRWGRNLIKKRLQAQARERRRSAPPVFNVNPDPDPAAERATTINFTASGDAELEALTEAAGHFDLEADAAEELWAEVREAVLGWRQVAVRNGTESAELRLFQVVLDRTSCRAS